MSNQIESEPTEEQNIFLPGDEETEIDLTYPKIRIRIGLIFAVIGYLLFLLGARPSVFGLDRSIVIGFIQISVFLIGLALMTFGSYITLNAFWTNGNKTIAADIGSRLISTGYVICVFTAMADIFGLGSHPLPNVVFGPLQARGMEIGLVTIAVGYLLLIRYKRNHNGQSKDNHPKSPKEKSEGKNTLENQKEPLNSAVNGS